jgi:uncharacterized protein YheU (UPF0270 family)
MEIPHKALEPDTLRNLVEEFVTREGTDYGHYTGSLADKVSQVLRQLESGRAVILYDAHSASCHIELRDRLGNHTDQGEDTEQ